MKLTKTSKEFDQYLDRVKELKDYEVDAGWFTDQGQHHSGYTYPDFARIHRNGVSVSPRDILGRAIFVNDPRQDRNLKRVINGFLKRSSKLSAKDVYDKIGKRQKRVIKGTFGDPGLGVTNNPTPLLDTGDWKNATKYRVNRRGNNGN